MDFISMVLTFIKGHTKLVIIAVLSLALLWGAFEVKGWYDYQIQQPIAVELMIRITNGICK